MPDLEGERDRVRVPGPTGAHQPRPADRRLPHREGGVPPGEATARETGVAYIVVSHDLAVVRQITDETLVMYRGDVVERGPTERILRSPGHPYTRMLLDSIPRIGWEPERIVADRRAVASA